MRCLVGWLGVAWLATVTATLSVASDEAGTMEADVHGYAVPEVIEGDDPASRTYLERCASCHEHPRNNVPPRTALVYRSPESVLYALSEGSMKPMVEGLDAEAIEGLVVLLTGRHPKPQGDIMANACLRRGTPVEVRPDDWSTIGGDLANTRFRDRAWLRAEDVPRLRLKWSFAYPGGASGPVVQGGDRLYLAVGYGYVMSIDAGTGCTHWAFRTPGRVVRSVAVAPPTGGQERTAVYFGDDLSTVTAVDAATGERLWATPVEENVLSRITAAPVVHEGRVFAAISSIEDPLTHSATHRCCTSRGGVVALDAATGRLLWKAQHITEPLRTLETSGEAGAPVLGPAGGSTYTPLALDPKRGVVYATTAEEYGHLNVSGPYSVIAYDLETGERRWARQLLPVGEARDAECRAVGRTDCRNMFSMGTAALLHTLPDGRELVLVGQKSGWVYALDPDAGGRVVWQTKVAYGGDLGGIMYGLASDGRSVFVPASDVDVEPPRRAGLLAALDPATGHTIWKQVGPEAHCSWKSSGCVAAQVAALTAVPGAVFAGYTDGTLRAFSTDDGRELLRFDTVAVEGSVNGVEMRGGQVSGYPVVIGRDAVYVTSGASSVERPGNALLVFTVDGR